MDLFEEIEFLREAQEMQIYELSRVMILVEEILMRMDDLTYDPTPGTNRTH